MTESLILRKTEELRTVDGEAVEGESAESRKIFPGRPGALEGLQQPAENIFLSYTVSTYKSFRNVSFRMLSTAGPSGTVMVAMVLPSTLRVV